MPLRQFQRQGLLYVPHREPVRRYVPEDLYLYRRYLERYQPQLAFAVVANTAANSSNASSVTTSGINTTGANLIIVAGANASAGGSITDSNSNSWTPLTAAATGSLESRLYYSYSPVVGSGHTFTNAGAFPSIAVLALSGSASSPFDVEDGDSGTFLSTLQPGSVTPTTNDQIVVCAITYNETGTLSISPSGPGFTISNQLGLVGGLAYGVALAHEIQTTATARNPTWSGMTSAEAATVIATFKSAAGGRKFILTSPA